MARWRNRKRPILFSSGSATASAVGLMEDQQQHQRQQQRQQPDAAVEPSSSADSGLQAALAELSHLQEMAAVSATNAAPPPAELEQEQEQEEEEVGEVTEIGELRLIRISDGIEAVVDSEPEVAAFTPFPAACTLPDESRAGIEILVGRRCPATFAEGFRKLRERLIEEQGRWSQSGRQLNSVAVISPRRGSGRSVIARNLAACLGLGADARVLLIDADPRKPSLHRRLRTTPSPGLAEAVRSGPMWRDSVRRVPGTGLYVLTLGALGTGAEGGLDDTLIAALLDRARSEFNWILIDSPSMETAHAEMLARLADSSLLVLRNQTEFFDEAEAALRRLDSSRLLGMILNFAAAN